MNIAIIGYGKMGRQIEKAALQRGHEISLIIDVNNESDLNPENLRKIDVAIEFSVPAVAYNNISECLDAGVPVVSGTTGWLDKYEMIAERCKNEGKTFMYASNFSLGVNIFFKLNQYLAKIMNKFNDYDVEITETHHTQKLDAPSGTAITLAQDITQKINRKNKWELKKSTGDDTVAIEAIRKKDVFGIHTIQYESDFDFISITHNAKSRNGFALGAVLAAEFIKDKKGLLTMEDMLDI
jgi:4-hydroxy-tetrahydrodipicolinate reductase